MNQNDEVSKDAVYSELYEEMRRFRDYHLNVSTWYTVILLAILGTILTVRFSSGLSDLSQPFGNNVLIRVLIVVFTTLMGFSGCYSVIYASRRYNELRTYVDENLEPEWKKEKFKIKKMKITPREFIMLTQVLLVLSIDAIVLL